MCAREGDLVRNTAAWAAALYDAEASSTLPESKQRVLHEGCAPMLALTVV
jgi:hypothetical protein